VDGRDAGLQEAPVIEQAVKRMTRAGKLKINIPHRIYWIYGQQLSISRLAAILPPQRHSLPKPSADSGHACEETNRNRRERQLHSASRGWAQLCCPLADLVVPYQI
jgi:hypothetical protein